MTDEFYVRLAAECDVVDIAAAEALYIDCPWTIDQVRSEIASARSVFVVAECGLSFVGYLSGEIAADECEISNIAVMEDFRRRGAATLMFETFTALVKKRGVKRMFLLVRENNAAAIELYVKLGFEAVGKRKNYYKGRDAVIMRKNLM